MNFQTLGGRTIAVDFAVPKEQYRSAEKQPKHETKDDDLSDKQTEEDKEEEEEAEENETTEEGDEEGSDSEDEDDESEDEDKDEEEKEEKESQEEPGSTLFIRNLELETQRHTIFEKYFLILSISH